MLVRDLKSLDPSQVLTVLDPKLEALAGVSGDAAPGALLAHFRARFAGDAKRADGNAVKNIAESDQLLAGLITTSDEEPPAPMPVPMDWSRVPGTNRPATMLTRFYWLRALADAFAITGDERYAEKAIAMTDDFFARHPLTEADTSYPDHLDPRRWSWMDLQATRRAQSLLIAMPRLIHAEAFTPAVLMRWLAVIYDHAHLCEAAPKEAIAHNMAMSEQNYFSQVACTMPEYRDARRWMDLALARMHDCVLAQTTEDGTQVEWTPGYHMNVAASAVAVLERADAMGAAVSPAVRQRIGDMVHAIYVMATPDRLDLPAFGDTHRGTYAPTQANRDGSNTLRYLRRCASLFDRPEYLALAEARCDDLPGPASAHFPHGGLYVLRSGYEPDATYLALHNPPGPTTWHDEPDNGTFELYAGGRWLLTDPGYCTYGEDQAKRREQRRTRVHQTVTLNHQDSDVRGRHLGWHVADGDGPRIDWLCVENHAYHGFVHRRTVWFVDRAWFVLLDEVLDESPRQMHEAGGEVLLHFHFAPPPAPSGDGLGVVIDTDRHRAYSCWPGGTNVLVCADPQGPYRFAGEVSMQATTYYDRVPRQSVNVTGARAPARYFLTALVPFDGQKPPDMRLAVTTGFQTGDARAQVRAGIDGRDYLLARDFGRNTEHDAQ